MNWIYEKTEDNSSRYVLGKEGKKPLVCIGINPSNAEPERLDNTLKSVERVAKANGYDSWIMLNVYPQRATNPNDLHDRRDFDLNRNNISHIKKIIENHKPEIWAAWGTLIKKRPYLPNCLFEIAELSKRYDCKWLNAGPVSKEGHPHHPLYLEKNAQLQPFDIDEYVMKTNVKQLFVYIKLLAVSSVDFELDFLKSLHQSGLMDSQYYDHMTTRPICIDEEMQQLANADYSFIRALLTAIVREDYYENGSLTKRIKNGDLAKVLKKLKKLYLRS